MITKRSMSLCGTALTLTLVLAGCGLVESTEAKQVEACAEDVKLGLNDPNSLEILSTETFKADDGTHRIELKFTAKNAFGGRVSSEAICGFKTEKDVVLNPGDIFNKEREFARNLRDAGMNLH